MQSDKKDQVEQALGGLERVEAPANFETMVRSRILRESAESGLGGTPLSLIIKFALPTVALLLLGVFFVLSGPASLDQAAVPPVVDGGPTLSESSAPLPVRTGAEHAVGSDSVGANPREVLKDATNVRSNRAEKPTGGSKDVALSPADDPLYPPGLDPTRRSVNPDTQTGSNISVSSILSMFGIAITCGPADCEAISVQSNSLAERAGVKKGDKIEAINERSINSTTTFSGTINVRTLRISRDGKPITVNLTVR